MEKRARPAQNACSITILGQICSILRKINLRAAGLAVVPPSMCECQTGEPTPQANHHVVDLGAHTQISVGMGGIGGGGASTNINMIEIGQEQKGTPTSKGKAKANNKKQSKEHAQHKRKQVRTKLKRKREEKKTKIHNSRNMDVGDLWAPDSRTRPCSHTHRVLKIYAYIS